MKRPVEVTLSSSVLVSVGDKGAESTVLTPALCLQPPSAANALQAALSNYPFFFGRCERGQRGWQQDSGRCASSMLQIAKGTVA